MSTDSQNAGRLIGIQHRRKKTKDGEARPTIVSIRSSNGTTAHELEEVMDELDFVYGKFPTAFRNVTIGEDLSGSEQHHIVFGNPTEEETLEAILKTWPRASLRIESKGRGKAKTEILTGIPEKVACEFEGVRDGDVILGIFGGSGKDLMIALINRTEETRTKVLLTAPKNLKLFRDESHLEKHGDAELLIELYQKKPELFHEMFPTDADTLQVMFNWDQVDDAMDQRKKVAQRAEQAAKHTAFTQKGYLGSRFAERILEIKNDNKTLQLVEESEAEAQKLLKSSVESHPLYQYVFGDIKGCGPRGFAKILSGVLDIRRFDRNGIGAFLRFCGYASEKGENGRNTIQRFRRGGKGSSFNPEVKQAIWLLIDLQFSRQPDDDNTPWGRRFRQIKADLRAKHPQVELHCDTEIPVRKGQYSMSDDSGEITVMFGKGKQHTFKKWTLGRGTESESIIVVPEEKILLDEGKWSVSNGLYTIKMADGSVVYRPGTSRYSKAHIHKIAGWKLGTEFCIYILKKWWEYVDMQEAARKQSAEKAA